MIDYKAVQLKLNEAGATPALVADGKWGPKSVAALRAFQQKTGLVVDGALGPKSLAKLGLAAAGAPSIPPTSAASALPVSKTPPGNPLDVNAYAVAKRAMPNLSEARRQYVLAVARGEGRFGTGWGKAPTGAVLEFAKSKGLTGLEGVGSNNWGAEQGSGDAGSFKHVDFGWRNPDGSPWNGKGPKVWLPYIGTYRRHSTPEKGFISVANTILNGGKRGAAGAKEIQDAIDRGDIAAAVKAQHQNGYFELNPADYLAAVLRNYSDLTSATGWKALLVPAAASVAGVLVGAVVMALGLGALAWLRSRST